MKATDRERLANRLEARKPLTIDPAGNVIALWVAKLGILALGVALIPAITATALMVWFLAKATVLAKRR